MARFQYLYSLLFLVLFTSITHALNLSAEGCVDQPGFNTCWAAATHAGTACYAKNCVNEGECLNENDCSTTDPKCAAACTCVAYEQWINCALSNCWNKVYTCEYMHLLVSAERNCPTAALSSDGGPYFPPSGKTPDSCSCDIYYVYEKHRKASDYASTCSNNQGATSAECTCCASSEAISSFYNTCPSTTPSSLPGYFDIFSPLLSTLTSPLCQTTLSNSSTNCSSIGYATPGRANSSPFYNADDLPPNGTSPMQNLPGSVSAPPFGGTLVWTFGGGRVVTATAASAGSSATMSGSVETASTTTIVTTTSGSFSAGSTASSTTTTTTASSPTSSSFAAVGKPKMRLLALSIAVAAVGFGVL